MKVWLKKFNKLIVKGAKGVQCVQEIKYKFLNISLYGEVYERNYMFHREGNLIACINEYIIVWGGI